MVADDYLEALINSVESTVSAVESVFTAIDCGDKVASLDIVFGVKKVG